MQLYYKMAGKGAENILSIEKSDFKLKVEIRKLSLKIFCHEPFTT